MSDINICINKNGYRRLSSESRRNIYFSYVFSNIFSSYTLFICCLIIFFEFDFLKYVAFIVICICMLSILYYAQDILLYHPNAEEKFLYFFPKMKHEQLEEVYISTSDNITLHGYFYKHPNSWTHKLPTILYLHGNAGKLFY